MGLARSVLAHTINFSYLLVQNSVLVMLFKDFVIQILLVSCWKLKQIYPSYQAFPRAKHGNPLSGWHRHRCFPLPAPATFPLILLHKSSLDYAMIKEKEWKITQEFGKGHVEALQPQVGAWMDLWCVEHVADLLVVQNRRRSVRDLFLFHTESFWGQPDIWLGDFSLWMSTGR